MSAQSSLPGFSLASNDEGLRRNPHDHIFFALVPVARSVMETFALGEELRRSQQLHEPLRPGRLLHVTVCALAGYRESPAKEAYAEAALVAASNLRFPQFQVTFDRVEPFGGGAYVLAGANDDVVRLAKMLGVLLRRAGVPCRQAQAPHMTLLYTERNLAPGKIKPLTWPATELVLIRSHPGESRHERLGAVQLTEPGLAALP